jgi:hypothetical protein
MIAVFFILIYVLNQGDIPGIPWEEYDNIEKD